MVSDVSVKVPGKGSVQITVTGVRRPGGPVVGPLTGPGPTVGPGRVFEDKPRQDNRRGAEVTSTLC